MLWRKHLVTFDDSSSWDAITEGSSLEVGGFFRHARCAARLQCTHHFSFHSHSKCFYRCQPWGGLFSSIIINHPHTASVSAVHSQLYAPAVLDTSASCSLQRATDGCCVFALWVFSPGP